MFRYLFSVISLLFIIISPCMGDIASVSHVNTMRDNVQAKIDKKADNANYTQNMVLQTDGSGNVVATTVGTDLFADGAIETMHLADGAVTNADLAGMIDITKLNLGTLPTSGKHMMIWNAESNEYVFERYATSILPDGYTQLEYIESTGTQLIDTGWAETNTTTVDAKFYVETPSNNYLYGTLQDSSAMMYNGIYSNRALEYNWLSVSFDAVSLIEMTQNISGDSVVIIINGNTYIRDIGSSGGHNMYINGCNDGRRPYRGTLRTYYFVIKDVNDVVRNFIPAKRVSDGEIGMYDTVTNTFFGNSGSGTFIAGPEI